MDLIPIDRNKEDSSNFTLRVTLDAVTYTLEFRWNVRLGAWFMSVLDADGNNTYAVNERLCVDYLIPRWRQDRSPPGFFVAVDTGSPSGGGQDPGFDDLGNRVQLWYVPKTELG